MKKILVMSHSPFVSGAEVLLISLAEKMKQKGIHLDFLLTSSECDKYNSEDMLLNHIQLRGLRYFVFPIKVKNKFFSIDERLKMFTFLKRKSYDIILFNSSQIAVLFAPLKKFLDSKLIFWSHSYRSKFTMRFISFFVDKIVGVSPLMKNVYDPSKTVTIYPGLYDNNVSNSNGILFSETGFDRNSFIVGSIGRIHPEKNLDDIILLAKETESNVKFVYIGRKMFHQGTYESRIIEKIKINNLEDRIKLIGYRDNVFNYLADFDLLLHTSKNESIGLSPIEGWMNKKCVLIRKYKYFPEVIFKDSENCLVYTDFEEMVSKFELIYRNEDYRKKIGKKGRSTFVEHFTVDKMAESFYELFRIISPDN